MCNDRQPIGLLGIGSRSIRVLYKHYIRRACAGNGITLCYPA